MRATASQSREPCCISVQMKSYPALAMAQYVIGSVEPKKVPPVTFSPRIIFSLTGFQIPEFGGASKAGPYFQVAGSTIPWLTPPGSALVIAPLSLPAGVARGNCSLPASGLLAYGSTVGGGVCPPAGCAAACVCRNPSVPASTTKKN